MFNPLNGRALVRPDPANNTTQSGIIVVKDTNEPALTGVVLAGNAIVNINDHIVFSALGWDEVTIDNEKLYLVSETAILGIF